MLFRFRPSKSAWSSVIQRRSVTTGDSHSYQPGIVVRTIRRVFVAAAPSTLRKKVALKMQKRMQRVETLEKEQLWLKTHGSPLAVMGLPDHAELPEVRARYRDLVLEIHPDASSSKGHHTHDQFELLQRAYGIATTPTSLFHVNGSAPTLLKQLCALDGSGGMVTQATRVRLFAVVSYIVMGLVGLIFSVVLVKQGLDFTLRVTDPEFYEFMVAQEKEEERKRLAGEPVDTDPKRLAPTVVKKLLFPGRYIHDGEDS